jgi:REP-associated tyrosine transposase
LWIERRKGVVINSRRFSKSQGGHLTMAQSLARLWTHLIFSTKNRFPFLSDKKIRAEMHGYLAQMLREYDCETLIVGGVEDHIHALFSLSRNYPIATVVKELKRPSAIAFKEKSLRLSKFYWQGGYGAFSVSQSNLDEVIRYIERQEEHHKNVRFQDEYRAFLKAYGIEYDERYVWD